MNKVGRLVTMLAAYRFGLVGQPPFYHRAKRTSLRNPVSVGKGHRKIMNGPKAATEGAIAGWTGRQPTVGRRGQKVRHRGGVGHEDLMQ